MNQAEDSEHSEQLEALLEFLRQSRGFDFTGYKRSTLERRIAKRMGDVGIADFQQYTDYLEVHAEEFGQLFNTILINVTAFFRDASAWEYLSHEVVPEIVGRKSGNQPIRVWSAGCASGQEPFTIAIVFSEALGRETFRRRVKIYATDVDEEALAQARQATYSDKEVESIQPALREKYFLAQNGRHAFNPELRRSIIFGRHDLVEHAPISRLDLLVCRNTLMYFNSETQSRIMSRFHFALNEHGYLFLGRAEMLLTHSDLFRATNLKERVFQKVPSVQQEVFEVPPTPAQGEADQRASRNVQLYQRAFDADPVPQLIVDEGRRLILANQKARTLFGLNRQDIGRPFKDVEVSYRPIDLVPLIQQAAAECLSKSVYNVERRLPDGTVQHFDVLVTPLLDKERTVLAVGISFHDVTEAARSSQELQRIGSELETAYEELQSTNEELQTTNEELQSTVEELETTNEELQSSNEELETTNEELQSSNEELQTMNDELRLRTDDVNQTSAFMQSILNGMQGALVVVDPSFAVRVWNRKAEELWGLRTKEVEGQSLFALQIGLPMDSLRDVLRGCLQADGAQPPLVVDVTDRRGKAARRRVVCMPHLGAGGKPQGAILLIEEI